TVPQTTKPIDSIEDLIEVANSDSYQIVPPKSALMTPQLLNADKQDRLFYAIGQHLNRTKSRMEIIRQKHDRYERDAIYITTPLISTRFHKTMMHIAQDRISADYLSLLLRKGCSLKKLFDPM